MAKSIIYYAIDYLMGKGMTGEQAAEVIELEKERNKNFKGRWVMSTDNVSGTVLRAFEVDLDYAIIDAGYRGLNVVGSDKQVFVK